MKTCRVIFLLAGALLYLLLSIFHPLIHDHPLDGRHHSTCLACKFLAVASVFILLLAAVGSILFVRLIYQLLPDYLEFCGKPSHEKLSIRGPPGLLV